MDRSYQKYFNMFMILGEYRKYYRQIANAIWRYIRWTLS